MPIALSFLRLFKQTYRTLNLPGSGLARDAYLKLGHASTGYRFYDREHAAIAEELQEEVAKILSFRGDAEFWFYEVDFEKRFAALCGKGYAIGTNSGTAALEFALRSLGVAEGDEVILPSHTFVATALAVANVGARPVFVDIDEYATIDVAATEAAITDKTKAILPVHMGGTLSDMDSLVRLAQRHQLALLEDCCQAFGSEWRGKQVPWGSNGCFSFNPTKVLGGVGNGGMLLTNDRSIKQQADELKDPTSDSPAVLDSHRTPCYLDPMNIAFLTVKLRHVQQWLAIRRERAALYSRLLEPCRNKIELPKERDGSLQNWQTYVIRTSERDKLQQRLGSQGIGTTVEYRLPVHLMPAFAHLGYKEGSLPATESYCNESLCLPLSQWMTEEEVYEVLEAVRRAINDI